MGCALAALVFAGCAFGQQNSVLDRARQLDSAGKCDEAEALYQGALRSGTDVAVLNNFGNHYLACREPEKAAGIFERLLKIEPGHANANLQMARLAEQRKDPAKALEYLDRVAKPDAEIQMARGEALAAMGRRDAAARILARIGKGTNEPRILFALGMTQGRAGFYGDAEQAFQRVLERDPGDDDVLFNLGAAAARARHFERAREAFLAILKNKPEDPDATYELGRVEAATGNYKRAIYLLAKARKAMPQRAEVNLALARAAEMGGYYGDAIAAYDEYTKLRPEDEFARRDRAAVAAFTRAGHEQARAELSKWVETHPNDAVGHYDLALAEGQDERDGSRNGALKEVARAIALDGRFQPARFYRAWLLQQNGKYEESLEDAKAAVALKPEDARALDLLGLDYLDLARAADAEPVLRKAMRAGESHPELMPDILFHMARCLSELGRREEARPLIARFQQLRKDAPEHPREQPGVIEAATLPPDELARRVAAEYREAVATNPNDARLRLRLAQALIRAGHANEAEKTFRDLLAMKPAADIARDAGNALIAERQYGLGAEFLRSATTEIPAAWVDLAVAEFFASGPDAALKALEAAPGETATGDYHVMRAMVLEAAGKSDAALAEMRARAGQAVVRPRLAEEGALLLARHGEAGPALDLVDRAIRSAPEDRALRMVRVAVLAGAGKVNDAQAAAKEIENRWPEWDGAWVAEAMLLAREARWEQAKARMSMAEALGARDVVAACVKERVTGENAGKCGCGVEVWGMIAGCGAGNRPGPGR